MIEDADDQTVFNVQNLPDIKNGSHSMKQSIANDNTMNVFQQH